MLELHCHTTYSDGSLTPTELVNAAIKAGVKALAITDHDTIKGWPEAILAAQGQALEIVPGIELSTVHRGQSLHILGFYPDPLKLEPQLIARLNARQRRAQQIIDKLKVLGYNNVEVPVLAEGKAVGRPHIADALVKAGYFDSEKQAMEELLIDGKPAYVVYEKFTIEQGISLLLESQAIPVWAHPGLFRAGTIEEVLLELIKAGLKGVEVYHPNHSPKQIKELESLCQKYNLIMTGGSDYHGPNPKGQDLDRSYLNQLHLELELLAPLKKMKQII